MGLLFARQNRGNEERRTLAALSDALLPDNGVAFIRAADMENGRVLFEGASKINERARQRITKGIGAAGDVLLSHKGTVGKVAFAPHDAPPFVCSPQTTFWRSLDVQRLDRKYLYAFLRSSGFHAQLATRSGETDMAPYVSLTSQRGLLITLPPIGAQRAIAHMLGTLDDRIELNLQMSETLEAIARALYRSWFVDFAPVRARAAGLKTDLPDRLAILFPDSFDASDGCKLPGGRLGAMKNRVTLRLKPCKAGLLDYGFAEAAVAHGGWPLPSAFSTEPSLASPSGEYLPEALDDAYRKLGRRAWHHSWAQREPRDRNLTRQNP